MVKVFYGSKMNAYLGGVLFREGVATFNKNAEGIEFANRFYLKYEIEKKPARKQKAKTSTTRKKVKKND